MIGFDHIYLYDNNSTEPLSDRVAALPRAVRTRLTVQPFRFPPGIGWVRSQHAIYTACMRERAKDSEWVAVLDADEYLYLGKQRTVAAFLEPFSADHRVGSVCPQWLLFGPDGRVRMPHQLLTIAAYRRRMPVENHPLYDRSDMVKCVTRPCTVDRYNVHYPTLLRGFRQVDPLNRTIPDTSRSVHAFARPRSHDVAAIAHYRSRSWAHVALRYRRQNDGGRRRNDRCNRAAAEYFAFFARHAVVPDDSMLPWVDRLTDYMAASGVDLSVRQRMIDTAMRERWFYGFPGWPSGVHVPLDRLERWLYSDTESDGCDDLVYATDRYFE